MSSKFLNIVHELEPKKIDIWSGEWAKHNSNFKSPKGVYFQKRMINFQIQRFFAGQNGPHEYEF